MFLLGTFVNDLFVACKINVTSDDEQGTNDGQNGGPILGAQLGAAMYVKLLAPCLPANRVLKAEDNTSKVKATAQL